MAEFKEEQIQELIAKSLEASKNSYSPYSNFPVGAALLCDDNTIITGCNVENASFGLTVCAERAAIVKAVSEGKRRFKAIAVSSPKLKAYGTPCGACRQVLVEFGTDWKVFCTKSDGSYKLTTIAELLPNAFTPEKLLNLQTL